MEHQGTYVHGFPHGQGASRVTANKRPLLSYVGDFWAGGFGKRGRLEWSDGSFYEGDVCHKDWIYLESRSTGVVYRVSAMIGLTGPPIFEPVRVHTCTMTMR